MVQPLHVGNALRLFLRPPADAVRWKIARSTNPVINAPDDPEATVIYEGDESVFLDARHVPNGVQLYYRPFYLVGGSYVAGAGASGTAAATYSQQNVDVLSFLRDRLEYGLKVEVERGVLVHELGFIPVFNAAPAVEQDLRFPMVTVHLESDDPAERGIGELIAVDTFDSVGDVWGESDGWIANVRVTVIGWCLNSDARIALRDAISRIVIANLVVFGEQGWQQIEFGQQDVDSVNGEFPVPMFQALGNFTCLAPKVVGGEVDPVREVEVNATTF